MPKAKEVRPLVERCVTLARRSLSHQEAADQLETDAERHSDAWRAWRKSDQWQEWNQAIAPVVAARRRAVTLLGSKEAVQILFDELAPRFADRPGGYTRILRLAKPRLGDAGEQAILEFVGVNDRQRRVAPKPAFDEEPAVEETTPTEEARRRRAGRRPDGRARRGESGRGNEGSLVLPRDAVFIIEKSQGRQVTCRPCFLTEGPATMSLARRRDSRPTGFDFTLHMRRLCEDMTDRVPDLRHIDLSRVAISFSQARKNTPYGVFASLTPMRFADGQRHTIRRGRKWGVQRLEDASGREMLYILGFHLPRFLDLDFQRKLTTVTHELWHIGPEFDGDIRRHAGRCYAHSASGEHDAQAARLAKQWLALDPPESTYAFLRHDFHHLHQRHGGIFGRKIPTPKLIPVD